MDKLTADVEKTRIAVSPLDGRIVDLRMVDWDHGGKKAHAINQAKNLPFQGCGASVSKLAMVWVWEAIRKEELNAKVICAVHDEIIVDALDTDAERVAEIMEEQMIRAFKYYAPSVPMEVKPEIADCWVH